MFRKKKEQLKNKAKEREGFQETRGIYRKQRGMETKSLQSLHLAEAGAQVDVGGRHLQVQNHDTAPRKEDDTDRLPHAQRRRRDEATPRKGHDFQLNQSTANPLAIQARSPKMEMISEGPRGRIWRVDEEGAEEEVGCVLALLVVKMPDGMKERFWLFGAGEKEIKGDLLLLSKKA
ncbi:hypothetical protein K458DRAFT_434595 [Lentithecium fluviatile CBS 122367]|uniref:Uncharacterized protein n=1 Tax=Lentithecium fluviatile CBS 122367 TaxID=1168545 RepID=A0A6G1IQH4_9PLEO|nr:hypothetical protein K458DRAFT_434595 [Lentithecium fluviatile CBS 122367]